MESTRDLRRRIRSVTSTQQITRAMKLVATVKLQKAEAMFRSYQAYHEGMAELLDLVAHGVNDPEYDLFRPGKGKPCYLVISSDLGLAGGYNANLLRHVLDRAEPDACFIVIGQKGRDVLRTRQKEILAQYLQLGVTPDYSQAREIGQLIVEFYRSGIIRSLHVVHVHARTLLTQEIKEVPLLPIQPSHRTEALSGVLFEPSAEKILTQLIPNYIQARLYGAMLDAKVAEFASRMTAMDAATENAQELIDELGLSLNRARQQAITKEIIEIVSGAEAL